ncbi:MULTISPECIES: ABC transporter substrate-binding protein [unclassified Paenibacillus]|uniref:peptide ABC transporter substrate-binding protein n=1 Tax=unclassified Paenibacillus TaxID=185978 RepID=UPI0009700F18|nr:MULTISPECIES: peptide ABC transporter substrate-binding protein [unclassified Paenibacillus]MBD8839859.1 peptide ABC transporter substrate-binding protein [Paenibacillus sp. CFBP 13594]OMF64630.1 peptide-binding protein [Paenibacillus sp. FSL R5-0765]PRA05501.1 peptide ABC transporter substrate-binding protein [Paenibacillus sp. MYb63]PRA50148.1 peptide ABC transporter substrate-binding protein [Paenibacillus sp. MYb67]QZN75378.1 peptide ABC transporter substrate-binding protein [Paenibacil
MKRKSLLVLLTLILAFGTVLAACGSKNEGTGNTDTGSANEGNGLAKDQILKINLSAEPPTLDPAQAKDSQTNTVLKFLYEGLVRIDADGKEQAGVAKDWTISEDGLKYVFNLNPDAKWSNGDAITAEDFVRSWERALKPETASPYAYQLYYIKGAEGYNLSKDETYKGTKVTDFSQVGVKATDEHTLEVTLENPTPYFLGLTAFYTYYPVHASADTNDKFFTDYKNMIVNGPFVMDQYSKGQKIVVKKNDGYHAAADIKLAQIDMSLTNSSASELQAYKSGQLDYTGAPNGEIPSDQIPSVKAELPDEFKATGIASTYYYQFNVNEAPFNNVKIRKAFAMAIQRQLIVDKVTQGGQIPAFGFVPPGIRGENGEFRDEHKDDYFTENVEEAKALLAEGMKEEGYTTLPAVTLIYNTSDGHAKIALAVADMWKQNLGVDVKTENQEWGVFLENRQNQNFQVARAGWSADYNDPYNFLEMWTTGNTNNDSKFSNEQYDKDVKETVKSADPAARMAAFADAEKILIQDEMGVMPIYYYTNVSLTKPYLKGVQLDFSGAIDFTRAYLEEK